MKAFVKKSWVVILFFVIIGSVYAGEDGKTYNGSYCKPTRGNESGYFNYGVYGIENASNDSRWITCPIITDSISDTSGTSRVWIHWNAKNSSDKINCYLYSNGYGGDSILQIQSGYRRGSGWFNIPKITKDDFWGDYYLLCQLPQKSTLNLVWLGESN